MTDHGPAVSAVFALSSTTFSASRWARDAWPPRSACLIPASFAPSVMTVCGGDAATAVALTGTRSMLADTASAPTTLRPSTALHGDVRIPSFNDGAGTDGCILASRQGVWKSV